MRLSLPMFPGGSIVQPGTVPGDAARTARNSAFFRTDFVHSNIGAEGEPEPVIDFSAIEERARAERDAWVGSKLKSFYRTLARKFARGAQAEMKNHLAE